MAGILIDHSIEKHIYYSPLLDSFEDQNPTASTSQRRNTESAGSTLIYNPWFNSVTLL